MQVVNLCQVLREDRFLHTIGEQIGQVISIDSSEAYKAKLFGPKIRLLVQDLDALPHTVVLPRLDGEGTIEYALEFSGLPNQCGRCRSREHQVRHCPKKDTNRKRQATHRGKPRRDQEDPPSAAPAPTPLEQTLSPSTQPQVHNPEPRAADTEVQPIHTRIEEAAETQEGDQPEHVLSPQPTAATYNIGADE